MAHTCSVCGSDWLFKAPNGLHHLCAECYNEMNKEVVDYHDLQKEAYELVLKGNVGIAIQLLHLVQAKRNKINKYFNHTLNAGHDWFANAFIPGLIRDLTNNNNHIQPITIWDAAFRALAKA